MLSFMPLATRRNGASVFLERRGPVTPDIARLAEAHPQLWDMITDDLKQQVQPPDQA